MDKINKYFGQFHAGIVWKFKYHIKMDAVAALLGLAVVMDAVAALLGLAVVMDAVAALLGLQ
jgi:hypothetical protein